MPSPVARSQLGLRDFVGGAWRLYRANFRIFAGTAAMVTVLQLLELFYAPASVIPLVFLALWPVIVGVVSQAIGEAGAGRPPSSVQAVYESIGWRGFLKLAASNFVLAVLVILGLCLLIVPGVYLWVRYQFVPQVLVREQSGFRDAFRHSTTLVRGHWWRVFGILLAVYGTATLVNLAALLVLSLVTAALGWSDTGAGVFGIAGMTVLWTLMDPLFFGVLLLLYADLRRVHAQIPP